ncbi:SDR family oxidoreductase [Minwuia sp.]|uniref:SDR family oxidoreductase n=1 Tax=Minwuia sp. TaxID=2493630 RepID=UPI003A92E53C
MSIDLSGRVALVTGASRGIGEATAVHLAACGAKVALLARSSDAISRIALKINAAHGEGTALAVPCDVASWCEVKAAVDETASSFGPVDLAVNNAGLIEPIARLADSDPAAWGHVIDVNVKGVYNVIHACATSMRAQGAGVIVNISSGAATSALEGWSHYCASKAAVLSLTACAHKELSEHGLRVVGLSPGTVATDMQVAIRESGVNPVSQLDPDVHIPPLWVAKGIAWLATDAGRPYDGGDCSLRSDDVLAAIGAQG